MREEHVNGLATASLIFGILAILGSVFILPTTFNAGLAIAFAWLSRGNGKMCGRASAGHILAVISIVISLAAIGVLALAAFRFAQELLSGMAIEEIAPYLEQIHPSLPQILPVLKQILLNL